MPIDFKTLREEFSSLHAEAATLIELAATEKRDLTGEEQEKNAKQFARLEQIQKTLDDTKRLAGLAFNKGDATLPQDPAGRKEFEDNQRRAFNYADPRTREEFHKSASQWFGSGSMAEQFASLTTATQSGIFLPSIVTTPIIASAPNVFREAYRLWGVPVVTTGTNGQFKYPVMDAAAGGVVTETASSENESPPSVAQSIVSTVKTYESGSVWFSDQDLQANDFDLLGATTPSLVYSKELGLESAITAAIVADAGITQNRQCTTATAITYADLVAWKNSLPKRYDRMKTFVLSSTAFAAAEGMVDSQNRPILLPDPQNNELMRLFGCPCLKSDYFETLAASHVIGIVFSLMGFHLRDAGQARIARYVDFPGRPSQTGADLFAFHAYGWAASAVSKLKTGLS